MTEEFNLSEKICMHPTCEAISFIDAEDVKEFIRLLKEKITWGKNHGNGDMLSLKATLEFIDTLAGERLK